MNALSDLSTAILCDGLHTRSLIFKAIGEKQRLKNSRTRNAILPSQMERQTSESRSFKSAALTLNKINGTFSVNHAPAECVLQYARSTREIFG